jgi:hypothetical protein
MLVYQNAICCCPRLKVSMWNMWFKAFGLWRPQTNPGPGDLKHMNQAMCGESQRQPHNYLEMNSHKQLYIYILYKLILCIYIYMIIYVHKRYSNVLSVSFFPSFARPSQFKLITVL